MRIFLISVVLAGLIVSAACAKGPPETAEIAVKLEYPAENWRPTSITLAAGGTVTWVNRGSTAHSVVSGEGLWPAIKLGIGEKFEFVFPKAGTYTYSDDPPTPTGVGTIYVE